MSARRHSVPGRPKARLAPILFLALIVTACAVPEPPPSRSQSSQPAASDRQVTVLTVIATDSEVDTRRALLLGSDDAINPEAAGYFMDIFRARVRQDLSNTGIAIEYRNRSVLITFPEPFGFEFGSAQLTDEASRVVDAVAKILREYRAILIVVAGHTDNVGDRQYNLRLSERRARSVAQNLNSAGISPRRLLIRGFGPDRPLASNQTEEGRASNRRFELILEILVRDEAVAPEPPEAA